MSQVPDSIGERFLAGFLRGFLRTAFRPFIGPPLGAPAQRGIVSALALAMPGCGGTRQYTQVAGGVPATVVTPKAGDAGGVILYLHGGAFCLGSPRTHRSITTRLALAAGMPVLVPDYRLAPEHPYPAALDDAEACYRSLRDSGYRPGQIVLAGDSAGGSLALALALRLKAVGERPAALLLISPVTDGGLSGDTITTMAGRDPMIRQGWLAQGLRWYGVPAGDLAHEPLRQDLSGLPPMCIQAGELELLRADSTRLADHARACGVDCTLTVYPGRWHVFHLQAVFLASARQALRALGAHARARVDARSVAEAA